MLCHDTTSTLETLEDCFFSHGLFFLNNKVLSFDRGSNFSGHKKGVRGFFGADVIYCHCRAHVLALCIKDAASELCERANSCLNMCASLYGYFSRSNWKTIALEEAQYEHAYVSAMAMDSGQSHVDGCSESSGDEVSEGEEDADVDSRDRPNAMSAQPLRLLRSVPTRWSSQDLAVSRVARIYTPLVEALHILESKGDFACGGFKSFLLKRVNNEYMVPLDRLLQVSNNFSKMLRSSELDILELDAMKRGFIACLDGYDDSMKNAVSEKPEILEAELNDAGPHVEPPRVSHRDDHNELGSLDEEVPPNQRGPIDTRGPKTGV
ncbi:hypothetical protein FOZ60_001531 [Perkinsus olseni]|uniref:Uncharacterized protein n=1 Tax=Perkinsus olseni TaxID=32597 RepID=A0A7J6P096_PEROL|nr:hypothetical protein FOZ60_001531 [Perkinsus olseni]